MNRTSLWLRLAFAACLLVPALLACYALVHREPAPSFNNFEQWCKAQGGCTRSNAQ